MRGEGPQKKKGQKGELKKEIRLWTEALAPRKKEEELIKTILHQRRKPHHRSTKSKGRRSARSFWGGGGGGERGENLIKRRLLTTADGQEAALGSKEGGSLESASGINKRPMGSREAVDGGKGGFKLDFLFGLNLVAVGDVLREGMKLTKHETKEQILNSRGGKYNDNAQEDATLTKEDTKKEDERKELFKDQNRRAESKTPRRLKGRSS